MNEHGDQLREAFESHEYLAPGLGAVYNGSQILFRRYTRRRRGAQVVSGAVLGAGLIAGGTHLPASMLPGATITAPPAPAPSNRPVLAPSARPSVPAPPPSSFSEDALDRQADFFRSAGYGHEEAVRLAKLWHMPGDILDVKAKAGRLLLAGRPLPIPPPARPPGAPDPDPEERAEAAFSDAGYSYEDAVRLAHLWKLPGPAEAKIAAGTKLESGRPLPIEPR